MVNYVLEILKPESLDERTDVWTVMSELVEVVSGRSEFVAAFLLYSVFLRADAIEQAIRRFFGEHALIANGKYGDGKERLLGRASDPSKWLTSGSYEKQLREIDYEGQEPSDLGSRLEVFYITWVYPDDTAIHAIHNAIGEIYWWLGCVGDEKLGRVLSDKRAIALYGHSIHSASNLGMTQIEYRYWTNVYNEDSVSVAGQLSFMLKPAIRDCTQEYQTNIRGCFQLSLAEIDRCMCVEEKPLVQFSSAHWL